MTAVLGENQLSESANRAENLQTRRRLRKLGLPPDEDGWAGNGFSPACYISMHSEGNPQSWVALQAMGGDVLKKDSTGKPLLNFGSYGSPIPNFLMAYAVGAAGGIFQGSATNKGDFISNGIGANTKTYVNLMKLSKDQAESVMGSVSIPVVSVFTHILDAGGLLDDKYKIYKVKDEKGAFVNTYISPSQTSSPTNKVSAHSGYACLMSMNCAPAFGGSSKAEPGLGLTGATLDSALQQGAAK
jgi:hypothetical protein